MLWFRYCFLILDESAFLLGNPGHDEAYCWLAKGPLVERNQTY